MRLNNLIKVVLLLLVLLNLTPYAFSQNSSGSGLDFSGDATITTQGISIVPALSLGKPAAIFNLSIGKRLRFEPDLRFSLEGKPWSFLFWFRYDLFNTDKFKLRIGAHPAINFITESAKINGATRDMIEARRFVAGELNSSYSITNNVSAGIYYLHGHGFDPATPANTDYISFKSNISDIHLFQDFLLTFNPQFYYLKIDKTGGFYIASGVTLSKNNVPLSISAFYNKALQTDILSSNILWNISLTYTLNL